jgi:hypothetical protein
MLILGMSHLYDVSIPVYLWPTWFLIFSKTETNRKYNDIRNPTHHNLT